MAWSTSNEKTQINPEHNAHELTNKASRKIRMTRSVVGMMPVLESVVKKMPHLVTGEQERSSAHRDEKRDEIEHVQVKTGRSKNSEHFNTNRRQSTGESCWNYAGQIHKALYPRKNAGVKNSPEQRICMTGA